MKTKDIRQSIKRFPRYLHVEIKLLEGLEKLGETNCLNALVSLPNHIRTMYIHSYQSYIWNCMTTSRLETYGNEKVVVGDLVLESDNENEVIEGDLYSGSAKVKILEEKDLNSYSIFDVVLPLPGTDSIFPKNKIGDLYLDLMKKDGIDLQLLIDSNNHFKMRGGYRKIIHIPKDLSWKVFKYNDANIPLSLCDSDRLENKSYPLSVPDSPFTALVMEFSLNKASYATMFLREFTKYSSSNENRDFLVNEWTKKNNKESK